MKRSRFSEEQIAYALLLAVTGAQIHQPATAQGRAQLHGEITPHGDRTSILVHEHHEGRCLVFAAQPLVFYAHAPTRPVQLHPFGGGGLP